MLKCASCGAEAAQSHRYCPSCGRGLAAGDGLATRTAAPSGPPTPLPSGRALAPGVLLGGRFRIVELLGKGGMGEVYRADDLTLGQTVALKFLPPAIARNAAAVERFRNEVRIARQVSHPNVCRVYDLAEIDGRFVLSMEYVDGEDLGALLRRIGRLPYDKAIEISRKLCAGLAAAHEKGVLHRDLKPSNVMLDSRGQVLLADFGLAGLAGEFQSAEVRNGTPAYMAPEQLSGKEVSARSDIYALGLVMYEIFTGKRPFQAETLAEMARAQREHNPVSLATLVKDLEPDVESAILRCLDPDPARRPASPLSVAAALPGADPLAAALAAGETPSPQMLVAAGEGNGLKPLPAVLILAGVLASLAFIYWRSAQNIELDRIEARNSREVLNAKARELIASLGYPSIPTDSVSGFRWDEALLNYAAQHDKPAPDWPKIFSARPPVLTFWYRESNSSIDSSEFHNDLLTPGIADFLDPAPIYSGMTGVILDAQGRLTYFEAMPPQRQTPLEGSREVDWNPLFRTAGLDPAKLQSAEPLWTFLAASDTRAAWTGTWPGSSRPLRVEAAALRGQPVAFSLSGPWSEAWRMPDSHPAGGQGAALILVALLGIAICIASALLARKNLKQNRGDRRGAFRLSVWMFCLLVVIWLCRGHMTASLALLGNLLLAACTALFSAMVVWMVYLAVEPYVRRRWPQTIISWTSVLSGRARDAVVGRDVLWGVVLGVVWRLTDHRLLHLWGAADAPLMPSSHFLEGIRATLGECLVQIPYGIRNALLFFFLLFLLRVFLRNSWVTGATWTSIFVLLSMIGSNGRPLLDGLETAVSFGIIAAIVLRFGLLSLAVGLYVMTVLATIPCTTDVSVWYFPNAAFAFSTIVALALWSCYTAAGGGRIWQKDFFD